MASNPPLGSFSATVSLLHNNLAYSANGWIASVHNSVNPGAGKLLLHSVPAKSSKDGPEVSQVTSIRYLNMSQGPVMCITSVVGTQIYNEDATICLVFVPVSDAASGGEGLRHHQGSAVVAPTQHIAVGTSKGGLMLIHCQAPDQFAPLTEVVAPGQTGPVADVCFNALSGMVVTVHSNGDIRNWIVDPSGAYTESNMVAAAGEAPNRVAALHLRLLVSYGPGNMRLYDALTLDLQAEIAAHARWTTAVDIAEEETQVRIATVGEDTVLNVWTVDAAEGKVSLNYSSIVTDKLLTGVAMLGDGSAAVTAYDAAEVFHVLISA